MRREKATKLIRDWANKLCIHPHTEDEYYLGQPSGYLVCTICGQTLGKKSTIRNIKNFLKREFRKKS